MTVVAGGGSWVGIAAEGYDIERHDETGHGTAEIRLLDGGTAIICSDISEEGVR